MSLFRNTVTHFALGLTAFAVTSAIATPAATPSTAHSFHIEDQWTLGGKGGWGFLSLDETSHQLFIPRSNRIMIVDTRTGKLIGEIEGMSSLRDLALDDSGKYGYATDVTDGTAGFVRIFDRSSNKMVASVPTDPIPFAIVFEPASKFVFAFSSRAHNATVIDTATNKVVATIALDGRPGPAVRDGEGSVFVTLPAQGEIQRIDAISKTITATWKLSPCTGPSNLAIDSRRRELFTTCENNKLVTVSTDTGQVMTIGDAPASAGDLEFDPRSNTLFLADPAGSLVLFHRDSQLHFTRLQDVKTQPSARTMVINHETGKAYLATAKFGLNSAAVSEELHYRPAPIPDTFSIIVVGR